MDFSFSDANFSKNFLIGQELVKRGMISQDQLDEGLIYQVRKNIKLGAALIELGYITEIMLDKVIADQFGIQYIPNQDVLIDEKLLSFLPAGSINKFKIIPIKSSDDVLTLCVSDPLDSKLIKFLQGKFEKPFELAIANKAAIEKAIEKHFYDIDE